MKTLNQILGNSSKDKINELLIEYLKNENDEKDIPVSQKNARKFCALLKSRFRDQSSPEESEMAVNILRTVHHLSGTKKQLYSLFKNGLAKALFEVFS
jgi:hypothetical protein